MNNVQAAARQNQKKINYITKLFALLLLLFWEVKKILSVIITVISAQNFPSFDTFSAQRNPFYSYGGVAQTLYPFLIVTPCTSHSIEKSLRFHNPFLNMCRFVTFSS